MQLPNWQFPAWARITINVSYRMHININRAICLLCCSQGAYELVRFVTLAGEEQRIPLLEYLYGMLAAFICWFYTPLYLVLYLISIFNTNVIQNIDNMILKHILMRIDCGLCFAVILTVFALTMTDERDRYGIVKLHIPIK